VITFDLSPSDLKLIEVENLGLQHDMPALTRALIDPLRAWEKEHGALPPAGVVRILLDAMETMRKTIQVQASIIGSIPPDIQTQLSGVASRYAAYKVALGSVPPEHPSPESLRPFLHNVSGVGHYTPDALTPFAIDNQLLAIAENRDENQANVLRYVSQATADLGVAFYTAALDALATGKEIAKKAAKGVNWTPILIGAGLILGLGVGVYAWRKGGQ